MFHVVLFIYWTLVQVYHNVALSFFCNLYIILEYFQYKTFNFRSLLFLVGISRLL